MKEIIFLVAVVASAVYLSGPIEPREPQGKTFVEQMTGVRK